MSISRLSLSVVLLLSIAEPPLLRAAPFVTDGSHVKLTLILVRETEACVPDGYSSRLGCGPLLAEQVDAWRRTRPSVEAILVRDESVEIPLTPRFEQALLAATEYPLSEDAAGRYSVVLAFDFGVDLTAVVDLERDDKIDLPSWSAMRRPIHYHRWFSHVTATVCDPNASVKWQLILNQKLHFPFSIVHAR